MTAPLYARTATELAIALSRGEVSARQLVAAQLERIAAVEGKVHAFRAMAAVEARVREASDFPRTPVEPSA